jgi:uncharacterized membrane protein
MAALWGLTAVVYGEALLEQISLATTLPFVLSGVVGSTLGRYFLYTGIKRVGASINSSIIAADPLFAVLIAATFLNEIPSVTQLAGGVIAVVGIALVAGSNGGNKTDWKRRALAIPALAAMLYGVAAVIRRYGFLETTVSPIYASAINETTALVMLSGGVLISRSRQPTEVQFENYKYLLLTGMLYAGGSMSLFAALDAGPVVIGSTLGSTAAVISVLASAVWLDDEAVTRRVVIGTVLTIVGVVAISI